MFPGEFSQLWALLGDFTRLTIYIWINFSLEAQGLEEQERKQGSKHFNCTNIWAKKIDLFLSTFFLRHSNIPNLVLFCFSKLYTHSRKKGLEDTVTVVTPPTVAVTPGTFRHSHQGRIVSFVCCRIAPIQL